MLTDQFNLIIKKDQTKFKLYMNSTQIFFLSKSPDSYVDLYRKDRGKNKQGALYNWYAVNTSKLCPIGWHVPI